MPCGCHACMGAVGGFGNTHTHTPRLYPSLPFVHLVSWHARAQRKLDVTG